MGTDMPGIVASPISGRAGVARSNRNTDNELKKLKAKLKTLPDIALKAVIRAVYPVIVRETVQDSGRAADNWWIGEGKAVRRFYVEDNIGPIGLPGERRSQGGGLHAAAHTTTVSPEVIIRLKIAYMEKFLGSTSFNHLEGATIYNQTPVKDKNTFSGSYEGNAKIRVAVSKGMVDAQGAIDMALREYI